ncbi:hypothetical protein K505DRAFT_359259 [Melanomma pulvis-pyrius CBS 109.77]|uniref:DUF6594 domain-containing protein n=1 Tax=Melanomma pulvis-pyrius CBS 109.77 TaxID=1314802 RepID=A0A6A6XKW0_9PLEO|nr:hypothetical protein K505DRAFT_359259 [Melanomma pulvis-pyrius CBS 109.77]
MAVFSPPSVSASKDMLSNTTARNPSLSPAAAPKSSSLKRLIRSHYASPWVKTTSPFLQNRWVFKKRCTTDPLDRTTIYEYHHVIQTVAEIGMTLADILLIGAILGFNAVTNSKARLGLVAMYALLIPLNVALLTNARRAEVFAATPAYAAVLVVLVCLEMWAGQGVSSV